MASLDQIYKALEEADKAGNIEDAKELAQMYKDRSEQINVLEGAAKAIAQGVSFGFSDEIIGAVKGAYDAATTDQSFSDAYDANVEEQRERLDTFQEQNPAVAYGGEILGAIGTGGGLARLGLKYAPKLVGNAPRSMIGRMGQAGAIGGAEGAVYGLGTGEESLENRAKEAAKGGMLGAVTGPLAPVIGTGAKKLTRGVRRYLASKKEDLSPTAYEMLERALLADGALEESSKRAIASGGRNAMLADATPSATALVDQAIQRGTPQGRQANRAIQDRVSQEGQQLKQTFDDALTQTTDDGLPMPVGATQGPSISTLYERAYAKPIDYSDPKGVEIEDIVRNAVPPSALSEAQKLMRMERVKSRQTLFKVADDGETVVSMTRMPDVRELDYITRGLNDFAKQQDGKGALGGTTNSGRIARNLARDIRTNLKELVPEYAQALKISGGKIRDREAYEYGQDVFKSSVTRDMLKDQLETMGEGEAREVARGIRNTIDERLANVKTVLSDPNVDGREAYNLVKELSSRASKQKLRDVMVAAHGAKVGGTKYRALMKQLSATTNALTTRAGISQNSKTFGRQALSDMQEQLSDGDAVGTLLQGRPIAAGQQVIAEMTGRSKREIQKRGDDVFDEVAEYLTKVRGLDAIQAAERIKRLAPLLNEQAEQFQRGVELDAISPLATAPTIIEDQP